MRTLGNRRLSYILAGLLTVLLAMAFPGQGASQKGRAADPKGQAPSSKALPAGPVGSWETQDKGGGPVYLELKPDGTGIFAGEDVRWTFNQNVLSITRANGPTYMYNTSLTPTSLTLSSAGLAQPVTFQRVGSGGIFESPGSVRAPGVLGGQSAPAGPMPSDPAGAWVVQGPNGTISLVLNPDGSGTFSGESIRWVFNQNILSLTGTDGVTYMFNASLTPTSLTIAGANVPQPITFQRAGVGMGPGGAPGAMTPGAGGGVAASPQDQQIAQLLLRSAWCSFSYSSAGGASGRSSTERVMFRPDGSGVRQTGGESYYSGQSGTVAGQRSGGQPFQWRVQGGILMLTADGVQWVPKPLQITTNSSGYPIVTSDGTEFMMCN